MNRLIFSSLLEWLQFDGGYPHVLRVVCHGLATSESLAFAFVLETHQGPLGLSNLSRVVQRGAALKRKSNHWKPFCESSTGRWVTCW